MEKVGKNYLKGGFWIRFFAFVIDQIIIIVLLFIVFFVLILIGINIEGLEQLIFWIVSSLYGAIMISQYETTLGKKLFKLKVLTTSYQKVNFGKALLRESAGKLLSTSVFSLGYLVALLDKERKTWHDKMAHTLVVKIDDNNQLIPVMEEVVTKKDKVTFWGLLVIAIIPLILSIFVILYLFFMQPNQIKGVGMAPNYVEDQYYLTEKWSYRSAEPQRGDVIVYKPPNTQDGDYFKRIIGLPGETIEIRAGKVYINENLLNEPYISVDTYTHTFEGGFLTEGQVYTIPQAQYFVLGDNRPRSTDSRSHGPVPKENIIGKMTTCYWNCNTSN